MKPSSAYCQRHSVVSMPETKPRFYWIPGRGGYLVWFIRDAQALHGAPPPQRETKDDSMPPESGICGGSQGGRPLRAT